MSREIRLCTCSLLLIDLNIGNAHHVSMSVFKFLYKNIFKPIVFLLDPEFVHNCIVSLGKLLGKFKFGRWLVTKMFYFKSSKLEQNILGINFENPIGLSAGFDKNAELLNILPCVGFGFAEVGSITGEYCEGNPTKRLWRLKKSKSLLVYYGLKNDGAEAISKRLQNKKFAFPVGVSVAKTNSADTVETSRGVADYVKAHSLMAEIGNFTTVNISCPNAFGGQPFTSPESLELLLKAIDQVPTSKPTFVKFSPDMSEQQLDSLLEVISRHKIEGIVCTNLTKNRALTTIKDKGIPDVGGMSGKVVEELSNKLLSDVYKKTHGKYVLIGSGGVFSAEDAYTKIRLGASLVQLITGMIYEGPQLIGEINSGLVKLLERDGFNNISEAVGVDSTENNSKP